MAKPTTEGRFELLGQPQFPRLSEGAVMEIRLQTSALADDAEIAKWLEETAVPLFPAGEMLRVRIGSSNMSPDLTGHVISEVDTTQPGKFVAIRLDEPLILRTRPSGYAQLADAKCQVVAIDRNAESINEACKIVAQVFQPHRRSNSANAFRAVFYLDEGFWLPLSAYRLWIQLGKKPLRPTGVRSAAADR